MPDLRAVGIIRVSEVGGRSGESFASPETQRERLTASCAAQGWELLSVFDPELDVSGGLALEKRPALGPAVKMIEDGKADIIVAAYFDRLFRSLKTQQEVIERVEAAGGQIFAVDMGHVSNATSGQWLTGTMMGAISEYYRRVTGEKIGEAQARAVARGVAPFPRIPAGYLRGPDGVLVPDPETRDIVLRAFKLRAEGKPILEVRTFLREHGIVRSHPGLTHMLGSRVYIGEIEFGKLHNPNAHEGIIPVDIFNQVQRMKTPRGRYGKSPQLLARLGVLRCGTCGRPMSVNGGGRGVVYYRCSDPNRDCPRRVAINAPTADGEVVRVVQALLRSQEGRAGATEAAWEADEALAQAQEELDAALRGFTAAGLLTEPAAIERLTQLKQARDTAQAKRDSIGSGLELRFRAEDWELATLEEQRALIRALIDRVEIDPGDHHSRWTGPEHRVHVFPRTVSGETFTE